jgi:tetratricopeptide (TPR) repeat protein
MTNAGKLTTKAVAVIVIVAMLGAAGLSPVIMVFFFGVILVVWIVARHSQAREVERIFDFYIAADAILREEERRWYGFEIAEVIEQGESLLEIMPDAPPLNYFVIGALYHRLGNHQASVEYLSRLIEDDRYDEAHRTIPSPQLRRYVTMLRQIEYHPSTAPQTLAAVRSLERARQRTAGRLLMESRGLIETETHTPKAAEVLQKAEEVKFGPSLPLSSISPPPPISKVLHDVYQDETTATN